ncbi:MAG: UpxY family transcription antiterminator [Vicingaceae bacterium]|nr:UpxY family transcription antiterminator [Vicingaceae bacterium]
MKKESARIQKNWYAIRTKPRAEKKVLERLTDKGYNAYLPLVSTIKIWSDRKKKVHTPLISSYVFVKTTPTEVFETLNTQGTAGVLRFLGKPGIVQEKEISNLQILMNGTEEVEPTMRTTFNKGEEVEVIRGPFAGLNAQAVLVQGNYRIVVNVAALGASFNVNIPMSFVKKKRTLATV